MSKESVSNAEYPGLILGLGRYSGEGNGNPLQYSCLEDPMNRGAWEAMVHRVTESQTRLKRFSTQGKFRRAKSEDFKLPPWGRVEKRRL